MFQSSGTIFSNRAGWICGNCFFLFHGDKLRVNVDEMKRKDDDSNNTLDILCKLRMCWWCTFPDRKKLCSELNGIPM